MTDGYDTIESNAARQHADSLDIWKVEASVWRLGPSGHSITNTSERFASQSASLENEAIYFFANLSVLNVQQ